MKVLAPVADSSIDETTSTKAYRCHYQPDGVVHAPGNPTNLYDSLKSSVFKYAENPALGWRTIIDGEAQDYEFLKYRELDEAVSVAGSAMKATVNCGKGTSIGVYAANSTEWMITMKAVDYCGAMTVPLYETFGAEAVEYIIKHSGISLIFCSSSKLASLAKVLPKVKDQVVQVVVWSSLPGVPVDASAISNAEETGGVPVVVWEKFLQFGKANHHDATPSGFKDVCTIMYTSGTTGDPKGVEITNEAILTSAAALLKLMSQFGVIVRSSDVFLSFLPLAHILDRVAEEAFLQLGGSIGYWQGDTKKLMDDVGALRPTIFAGVPRIYDRVYTGVTQKVKSSTPVQRAVFGICFRIKEFFLNNFGMSQVPIVDKLAFSKVKARLGGRVRLVISGGAPLASHVEHFLKVTMCAPVSQGYGLTETCGGSFIANPNRPEQVGTVGPPVAGLDVRLESIPEMGYDATTKPYEGEVCLRGPAVFAGYHKRPDLTEKDYYGGWFHTGDVGRFEADGSLRLIDRKKNFFKLSHGEYVAAEKLENEYKKDTLVDQIWVYGDSTQAFLVGVVVPEEQTLVAIAHEVGVAGKFAELCDDANVEKAVQQRLEKAGRASGLKGFEIIKQLHLFPDGFSEANDLMTPSFKLKRPQLKKRFAAEIAAMYD